MIIMPEEESKKSTQLFCAVQGEFQMDFEASPSAQVYMVNVKRAGVPVARFVFSAVDMLAMLESIKMALLDRIRDKAKNDELEGLDKYGRLH